MAPPLREVPFQGSLAGRVQEDRAVLIRLPLIHIDHVFRIVRTLNAVYLTGRAKHLIHA